MSKFLVIVVLVLVVIAIAQLTRLYELNRKLHKKREEEISYANNKLNAGLMMAFMVLFFGFFIYLSWAYGDKLLPVAASEHGAKIDFLFDLNLVIVSAVFFVVNFALFYFASKYYKREGGKATFLAHDNRLELWWTVIPSIVLFVIIITGLVQWNNINDDASEDAIQIELYSRQFDWTARYPGDDDKMGLASFNFISSSNPLGLVTEKSMNDKLKEINEEIETVENDLENKVFSDDVEKSLHVKLRRLSAQKARIHSYQHQSEDLANANDDKLVKAEFHLPVGQEVEFIFRSQDVIHSAYMPHFRAQMNTVPGMVTRFKFVPTITTDSMRTITGDKDFNYILLCNKICGAAHYNMKMDIIVESKEDYEKWLSGQKTFAASIGASEESEDLAINE